MFDGVSVSTALGHQASAQAVKFWGQADGFFGLHGVTCFQAFWALAVQELSMCGFPCFCCTVLTVPEGVELVLKVHAAQRESPLPRALMVS